MQNPIRVEKVTSLGAQIIGVGQIANRLKSYLANQGITAHICSTPKELNLNQSTDYLFWILKPSENLANDLLVNLVRNLQARLILISPDSDSAAPILSNLLARDLDVCAISLYHCYGPKMDESVLAVLWDRLKENLIALPENDQMIVAPLYLDDALEAICRIAFTSRAFGRSFILTGTEKISLLSLSFRLREEAVRTLGKLPQVINVLPLAADLATTASRIEDSKSLQKEINWRPHYDLSHGLTNAIAAISLSVRKSIITPPEAVRQSPVKSKKKITKLASPPGGVRLRISHRFKLPLIIVGFILFAFLGIIKFRQFAEARVAYLLNLQSASALAGDTKKTGQLGAQIKNLTALGQSLSILSGGSLSDRYLEAQANIGLAGTLANLSEMSVAILANSSSDLPAKIAKVNSQIEELLKNYPNVSWHSKLGQIREFLPVGEWLLGLDKKRTILLVIQNPAEIRPTGGFISSIGYMVIDKGRFLDLNFVDTYQLDANLTGEQLAPEPIQKYLGENSLLIRDSNWDPHAPQSAQTIQKLVERAGGRSSDGVIFLSAEGLKYILQATGPVLTPLGDEISSANILDRVAFGTNNEMNGVLSGLRQYTVNPARALKVLRGVFEAFQHQELFIAANNSQVSQVLGAQSADGGLENSVCPFQFASNFCINDYLMPVEANLGVNRADYIINKSREIEISLLADRELSTTIKLQYQNSSENQNHPVNNYKGYVQVLLPNDTQVKSVTEQSVGILARVDQDLKLEQNKLNLGFYIDVPANQTKTYIVHYTQKINFDIREDLFGYNLLLQKQQGSIIPTLITLSYPESMVPLVVSRPAISVAGALSFYLTGDQTENISVQFASVR